MISILNDQSTFPYLEQVAILFFMLIGSLQFPIAAHTPALDTERPELTSKELSGKTPVKDLDCVLSTYFHPNSKTRNAQYQTVLVELSVQPGIRAFWEWHDQCCSLYELALRTKTPNIKSVSDSVETFVTAQRATCCKPSLHRDLLWTDIIHVAQINILSPASAFHNTYKGCKKKTVLTCRYSCPEAKVTDHRCTESFSLEKTSEILKSSH